ncbi:VLRF1 family aeRF1-type release factor [Alteribacillus iranensis]|uniref:Protein required for attachment to host cells n=1 Tax=Alteribacillus iranensis TaxID=930128 RepID=A0A1I2FC68_9BACI|nr:VLRF1 family aeRF1-type release factor [Alteribacillus iranensis]SFF02136.1 hypothetical protein SAMN05192532_11028 [Alteribacillus iranensis]
MMALPNELKSYKSQQDDMGILTIYLNTDFGDGDQHSGEWKIRLKNGLKKIEEYVEQDGTKDERKALKNLAEVANRSIYDQQSNMKKSFVFMASADESFHEEKILQVPVETSFHWEKQPVIDQLEQLHTKFPAAGMLLVQKNEVVLLDTALGEVREEKVFHWDVDSEDWRRYEGNADMNVTASGSTQVDEVQRRFDENRQRWYKKLAPQLDKEIKNRSLEGIYLIGDKEYTQDIEQHLGAKILGHIPKNLISKQAHEILNEVYKEEIR